MASLMASMKFLLTDLPARKKRRMAPYTVRADWHKGLMAHYM